MKIKLQPIATALLVNILLAIFALIAIWPLFFVFGSSFNETSSLATAQPFPEVISLKQYRALFAETNYLLWYRTTFIVAVVNMLVTMICTTATGYTFARLRFFGRKKILLGMLVLQSFPSFLTLTAIYIMYLNFGFLNKPLSLVLVYALGAIPFGTWLVMGYFRNIPLSLDEAAMIDGANKIRIFFHVLFPLCRPIMVFLAVTSFIAPWMDYILPRLIITSDEKKTLAIGLFDMITGDANSQYSMFAAGAVLVAIPITMMFYFFQKFFVQGIVAGANK